MPIEHSSISPPITTNETNVKAVVLVGELGSGNELEKW